ncbi:MAG: hypothetical protein S4CHLAM2_09320 [Chlamydiales bacterium]|nr:hypothetical protein [Chlamydiales bacterium]
MYVGQPGSQRGVGAHGLHFGGHGGGQDGSHFGAHGCGQGGGQHGSHFGGHLQPHGSQKQSAHLLQLAKLNMLITNRAAKNIFKDRFI